MYGYTRLSLTQSNFYRAKAALLTQLSNPIIDCSLYSFIAYLALHRIRQFGLFRTVANMRFFLAIDVGQSNRAI